MTSRDLVIRTLQHRQVERVPRDLWTLPGTAMFRRDEVDRMLQTFPSDFTPPKFAYAPGDREKGTPNVEGEYTDAWGCVWHVARSGVIGEVKQYPLADWSALARYKPPYEILEKSDLGSVNLSCAETSRFVLAGSKVRPFERMQFLRGSEATYIDLAYGSKEIFALVDMLHDFHLRDLRMWARTDVDGVSFMDDWGSQHSLLISPHLWRDIFKPLYRDYCALLHESGKYAFFHSDGNISAIIGDLIEVGIDALNSQLFCMNIEELGEKHCGRVTFWGEIDRQRILPFGTVDEVRSAVRRVRRALDRGSGGVIAQCEWGIDDPFENIAAVFDEWVRPLESTD